MGQHTKELIKNIDYFTLSIAIVLSLIGMAMIYSCTYQTSRIFLIKQMLWFLGGLVIFLVLIMINYKKIIEWSFPVYVFSIIPLMYLLIKGKKIAGAKSWIDFGQFQVQPAEFAKIAAVILLTKYFVDKVGEKIGLKELFYAGIIIGVPVSFVVLQPDFGTALTFFPGFISLFFLKGIKAKLVFLLIIIILLSGVFMWEFVLKDYQKARIKTFIYPQSNPKAEGYHLLQSKIAIGSSGFFGKGYLKGTQTQSKFLPAQHTDFILSVLAEEFGFFGILIIFSLYLWFILRFLKISLEPKAKAGILLSFSLSSIIIFQFFINCSMLIGLFPIVGIPLPLLSYGGSSLLSTFIIIALIINIRMRKYQIF
ncbi:MAG: rod shape-determining protein RodA [Acidobacteriota bacterium]